jgi:hypothetical protein
VQVKNALETAMPANHIGVSPEDTPFAPVNRRLVAMDRSKA